MADLSLTEFAEEIEKITPVVMRGFAKKQTNEFFRGKITLPQFFILSYLESAGELKMKDLAKVTDVTTAAATGIIDRLVRYGYVTRVNNPDDRRVIYVKLTSKGSELTRKVAHQRREAILDVFGKISREERENYLSILMHIRDVLAKENGSLR